MVRQGKIVGVHSNPTKQGNVCFKRPCPVVSTLPVITEAVTEIGIAERDELTIRRGTLVLFHVNIANPDERLSQLGKFCLDFAPLLGTEGMVVASALKMTRGNNALVAASVFNACPLHTATHFRRQQEKALVVKSERPVLKQDHFTVRAVGAVSPERAVEHRGILGLKDIAHVVPPNDRDFLQADDVRVGIADLLRNRLVARVELVHDLNVPGENGKGTGKGRGSHDSNLITVLYIMINFNGAVICC